MKSNKNYMLKIHGVTYVVTITVIKTGIKRKFKTYSEAFAFLLNDGNNIAGHEVTYGQGNSMRRMLHKIMLEGKFSCIYSISDNSKMPA